jgi:hypothetical protein
MICGGYIHLEVEVKTLEIGQKSPEFLMGNMGTQNRRIICGGYTEKLLGFVVAVRFHLGIFGQ